MNFAELVALMVVGTDDPDSITGVLRHWGPDDPEWTQRIWRRGGRARRETVDGQVVSITGGELRWYWQADAGEMVAHEREAVFSSPIGGLEPGGDRPSFSRWDGTDFTRASGPVTATTLLGRECWHVELAPPSHKPFPIELTVDAATGLVLRDVNPQYGSGTEFTEVSIGLDLPDDLFCWPGPARPYADVRAERDVEHEQDMAERRAWLDAHGVVLDLPIRPRLLLHERDDGTGAFHASIDAHLSGSVLRRPVSAAPWPDADEVHYDHAYRWSDSRWDWLLGSMAPIADEQMALLKVRLADST